MRKLVNILLLSILFISVGSAIAFYIYRVEIIQLVVSRDLAQKAPEDYPRNKIYDEFRETGELVKKGSVRKALYLEKLFEISHRVERDQSLTPTEIETILQDLRALRKFKS